MEELIPWLYLKGVSTGDFTETLQALLGPQAAGLSVTTVTRLITTWQADYETWNERSLIPDVIAGVQFVDGARKNAAWWLLFHIIWRFLAHEATERAITPKPAPAKGEAE